ncbi:MAG: hypothetical protein ACXVJZ_06670, partial [Acidimicrobiia bacterium]
IDIHAGKWLDRLIVGEPIGLTAEAARWTAAWAFKTMVSGRFASVPEYPVEKTYPVERAWTTELRRYRRIPAGWSIWAGRYLGDAAVMYYPEQASGWMIAPGDEPGPGSPYLDVPIASVILWRFFLRIVGPTEHDFLPPPDPDVLVPVWPPSDDLHWPPPKVIGDDLREDLVPALRPFNER